MMEKMVYSVEYSIRDHAGIIGWQLIHRLLTATELNEIIEFGGMKEFRVKTVVSQDTEYRRGFRAGYSQASKDFNL